MFETDLSDKLKRIFQVAKVTFDAPSDAQEQDVLFVQIEKSLNRIVETKQIADVTGKILIYSQNNRIPFGYISKQIEEANPLRY